MGPFGRAMLSRAIPQPAIRELQFATSRVRATLVRQYLQSRFGLSSRDVGIVPLRGVPPAKYEQEELGRCLPRVAQAKGLCTLAFLCTSFCAAAKPPLVYQYGG